MATRDLELVLSLNDQASRELNNMQGRLEKMRPTFKRAAVVGSAAFAGITAGIGKAVNEARKAEDIETLFGLAFEEVEDDARKMVNTMAEEMGRAESQIQETVANSAFQLRSMTDMGEQEMLDMASSMVPATEGLALLDRRVESGAQVMQAFTDALSGSRQQFNRLVTPVNDKIVQDKALAEGIIEQGEELTKTKEAMALYAIFMDNTTAAQEIMDRESRGFTDSLRQLEAAWITLQQNAGEPFIDLVADIVNKITPLLARVGEWIQKNPELTKNIVIVTAVLSGLVAILSVLGLVLLSVTAGFAALSLPVVAIVGVITAALIPIILLLVNHWSLLKDATITVWETIRDFIVGAATFIWDNLSLILGPAGWVFKAIVENFTEIRNFFEQIWDSITAIFEGAASVILGVMERIISSAERAINLARRAKDLAGGAIGGARDAIGSAVSRITPFAEGGIVRKPTLGLVGEAGPEAVVPLDKAGGMGGVTVIVNGDVSGRELVDKVQSELTRRLKR